MTLERERKEEFNVNDNQAKIDELARSLNERHTNNRRANQALLGRRLSESSMLTTYEQETLARQRYQALVAKYRTNSSNTWYWEVLEKLVEYLEAKEAEYQRTNRPPRGAEPSRYAYALRLFRQGLHENYFAKKTSPPQAYGIVLPELLACLWLAANDETLTLSEENEKLSPQAKKTLRENALEESFVFNLWNIRTEHTNDFPQWTSLHVRSGYHAEHASCLEGAVGRMIKIMWPLSPHTTIFNVNQSADEKYLGIPNLAQAFVMVMLQGSTSDVKKAVYQVATKKYLFEEVSAQELKLYEEFYTSLSMTNFYNFIIARGFDHSAISRIKPSFNQPSDYEMVAEILSRTKRNYEITKLEKPNANVIEQLRRPGAQLYQEAEIMSSTELERVMRPRRKAHDRVEELKAIEFSLRNAALRSLITQDASDEDEEAIKMLPILTKHTQMLKEIKSELEQLKREINAAANQAATEADEKFQQAEGIQALGRNAKAAEEAKKKAVKTSQEGLDKIPKLESLIENYRNYLPNRGVMKPKLLQSLGLQTLGVGNSEVPSWLTRFIDVAFSNNGAYFTKAEEMRKLTERFQKLDKETQRLNFTIDSYGYTIDLGAKILSSFPESNNWRFKQAVILFLNHLINVYEKDHHLNNAQLHLPQFEMLSDDDKKAIQMFVALKNQCAPNAVIDLGYHATLQFDELIGRQPDQYLYLQQSYFSVPKVAAESEHTENKEEKSAASSDIVDHDPQNEKSDPEKLKAWQQTALNDILKTPDLPTKSTEDKKDARFDAMVKFLEVSLCSNLGLTAFRKSDSRFFETLCSIYLTQTGAETESYHNPIEFNGSEVSLPETDTLAQRVEKLAAYFSVLIETLRPYRTEYNVGLIRLMDRETASNFFSKVGSQGCILRTGIGAPSSIIVSENHKQNQVANFDTQANREYYLKRVSQQLVLIDYNHLTAAAAEMAEVHNNTKSNYVSYAGAARIEAQLSSNNRLAAMASEIIAIHASPVQQEQKVAHPQAQEEVARKQQEEAARKQQEEKVNAARKDREAAARQVVRRVIENEKTIQNDEAKEIKSEAKHAFFETPSAYRGFKHWYVQHAEKELVIACIIFFNDKNNQANLNVFIKQLTSGSELLTQMEAAGGYQELAATDFSFSKNGMRINIQSRNYSADGKKVQCHIVADIGEMRAYLNRYAPEIEEKVAIAKITTMETRHRR